MRVVRTILGILLLTIGLPLLLVGGGLWAAMQHRDAGGAFSGDLEEIRPGVRRRGARRRRAAAATGPVRAHRADAPAGQPRTPAPARRSSGWRRRIEAATFLAGVEHTRVDEVRLARGRAAGARRGGGRGGDAGHRSGAASGSGCAAAPAPSSGTPSDLRGRQLAWSSCAPTGEPAQTVSVTAEVRPGLAATPRTWGLLVLGSVMALLGIALLAWPVRAREVVYVVDPSQVPDIAARLGVPLPSLPAGAAPRPATLAESAAGGGSPVARGWTSRGRARGRRRRCPRLAWPPVPMGRAPAGRAPRS